MASDTLKKILKGVLIGGGTVLSLFAPAVGAPLIIAGTQVKTGTSTTSADTVSTYAANLNAALLSSSKVAKDVEKNILWQKMFLFLENNWLYIIAGIMALFFIPKLLRKRR